MRINAIVKCIKFKINEQSLVRNRRLFSKRSDMSNETFKDFSFANKTYASFRPQYPDTLFEDIIHNMKVHSRDLAIDIGAGTGQATIPLAKYFNKVIGFDPSPGQLTQTDATSTGGKVEFREGNAEHVNLPDKSCDLIVTAQAVHWFDHKNFFAECERLLKPDGLLAIWGYSMCHIDHKESDDLLWQYFSGTLGNYWDEKRKLVDNRYVDVIPSFGKVERANFEMIKEVNIDEFIGYLQTWSAWNEYKKVKNEDPIPPLMKKMEVSLGNKKKLKLTFPIFIIYVTKGN